jgi:cbb3-type cytochrome oxidase subunit 3
LRREIPDFLVVQKDAIAVLLAVIQKYTQMERFSQTLLALIWMFLCFLLHLLFIYAIPRKCRLKRKSGVDTNLSDLTNSAITCVEN